MIKRLFLLSFFCLTFGALVAQEEQEKPEMPRSRFLNVGLGWSLQKVQDDGMSPLLYRGSAGSLVLGYSRAKGRSLEILDTQTSLGLLRNRYAPEISSGRAINLRIDAEYAYLRLLKNVNPMGTSVYFGGIFSSVTNARYHNLLNNSSFNYGGYNGFGITGAIQKELDFWKRSFLLRFRASLPLATYVTRPNYVTLFEYTDPDYNGLEDLMDNSGFYTWNRFFRLNFRTELSYRLPNKNELRLGYIWDYYSYTKLNPVEAAAHYVQFSSLFYF